MEFASPTPDLAPDEWVSALAATRSMRPTCGPGRTRGDPRR